MHTGQRITGKLYCLTARWPACAAQAFALLALVTTGRAADSQGARPEHRLLYVAEPGIRDYVEYGGHGIIVFDIDHGHRFVKRIPLGGLNAQGKPMNVKGICASARTGRVYVTTLKTMICVDLLTDKTLWEKDYPGGCDRLAISPDGSTIYVPSLEGDRWNIVDAHSGELIGKLTPKSGAHNTIFGPNGKEVYLAGLKSPYLSIADPADRSLVRTVGPFSAPIRPFTINGKQTLCFVNVNDLLGFEVGDLKSGKKLYRVEVKGFMRGMEKRHGCPSHGIGMTPDETEIWVSDAANSRMQIFDATVMPPRQKANVRLRDQPGWVTFSIDGQYAYPSTGDVIETRTKKIVTELTDEKGREVQSEKLLEIDFAGGRPVQAGNQFGLGQIQN